MIAFVLIVVTACGGDNTEPESVEAMSAVDQMLLAFDGEPSKAELVQMLDRAFDATNTPTTDENYSRAGSVLVTFKNEYGLRETDILECIPHRAADPRAPEVNFANVAAVCATDLKAGTYP